MADAASKKRLGQRVRLARTLAGMTQLEVARKLGVSQGVVSNVETGVSTIDVPDLPRWAQVLKTPIMAFFIDEISDDLQRATAALYMFPDERLLSVARMLENMAGDAIRGTNSEEDGSQPA